MVQLINKYHKQKKTTWNNKVDKVSGKGLSTEDYTTTEKNKLAGIASGAEINVQSDWNATSGDAFILNKPAIPTKVSDLTNDTGYITGYTETDPIFTAWNKSTGISITKSQITDFPTSMPPTAHSTDLLTSGTLGVARRWNRENRWLCRRCS